MKQLVLFLSVALFLVACVSYQQEKLVLEEPSSDEELPCSFEIKGEASGSWFFEASFPYRLEDASGVVLAQGAVLAEEDWMTAKLVPFSTQVTYQGVAGEGRLIFEKDNPSGLPEYADRMELPVRLQTCE